MMEFRRTHVTLVAVLALGLSLAGAAACGVTRGGYESPGGGDLMIRDAATADAPACPLKCSLDGRSVVDTCTGATVQTCSQDLACGAGTCQKPCDAAAADQSSNGCDFYFQPPLFTKVPGHGCFAAYVVNTSTLPVDISLELQGQPIDVSRAIFTINAGSPTPIPHAGSIAPGESAILFVSGKPDTDGGDPNDIGILCPPGVVPATFADPLPDGSGLGNSFHLTTNAPIGLASIFPFGGAPSYLPAATLLLPVATWGTQSILVNAYTFHFDTWRPVTSGPSAQIVASEDDTDITILPTKDIQDGVGFKGSAALTPVTYHLGKGQLLQIDQVEELTGTIVTSNKPTSIFGGHDGLVLPSSTCCADVAGQQLPSVAQWGSEYAVVGYRARTENDGEKFLVRLVAARDGTRLDYDPPVPPEGAPVTMSAGQHVEFWTALRDPFIVRTQDSDHPIYVATYMSGGYDFGGAGDPEYVNVIPSGQYLNSYSFYADPTYDETSLVVVRPKSNGQFKDVWLECAGNLTGFRPIGTKGNFEFVRVDLMRHHGPGQAFDAGTCQSGLQRMRSDAPFTATLWGWSFYASYAYPGGTAQRKLAPTPLHPIR